MSNSHSQPPKSIFQTIKNWLRSSSIEVASASKIGKVRLSLSDLKQDQNKALQDLGRKTYELLKKEELKAPQLQDVFDKIRSIEKYIIIKEAEVEQYVKEKEQKLLGAPDVRVSSPVPLYSKPVPKSQPKPAVQAKAVPKPKPVASEAPQTSSKPKAAIPATKTSSASVDKPQKPKSSQNTVKKEVEKSSNQSVAKTTNNKTKKTVSSSKGKAGNKKKEVLKESKETNKNSKETKTDKE